MRGWYALLAAGLAACSFTPGRLPGDGGAPDGDLPDDDAPDATVVGPDGDGDGVADSTDNCPAIANDQRNHDGDPRGDACDRCPHLVSSTDPDLDSDGVGDDCDPRQATAGDSIVMWEGFYDNTGYATWTGTGSWSVANGVLTQAAADNPQAYTLPSGFAVVRTAVTTGVRIVALGTATSSNEPTVSVYGGVAGSSQGYLCSVSAPGFTNDVDVYGYWPGNGSNINTDGNTVTWPGTFAAMSQLRLTDQIVGANHTCIANQAAITVPLTATHGPTAGTILLLTELASADFDYVFVVSVGN